MQVKLLAGPAAVILTVAACHGADSNAPLPPTLVGRSASQQVQRVVDHTSMLKTLKVQQTIGSTVDPLNGDQNPYGLVYEKNKPFSQSVLKRGDLVLCNFNDKANVQGRGTTVDYIGSAPGSKPARLVQSSTLLGCASLAINAYDEVFAANSGAKNAQGVASNGKIVQTLKNALLVEPWGSVYVPAPVPYPPGDGLWISDASSGKIVRINLGTANGKPTYTAVISGFAVNHGKPGSILAPSGLQYNPKTDTLYVVDGVTNTLVAFHNAYKEFNSPSEVVVGKDGITFSGPKAKDAQVIYHGGQLDGPISSTLLPNGNFVLGNTLNKKGKNLLVEIAVDGTLLAYRNVDKGNAGALFGIASSGSNDATTQIYFNDDNSNTVEVLKK